MRKELDELLCQQYPELFGERHQPDSCMTYRFECGDGWYPILSVLCAEIQREVSDGGMPAVRAVQVKEKYGRLRFRFRGGDARTRAMVRMAEAFSERACEECGAATVLLENRARCTEHI